MDKPDQPAVVLRPYRRGDAQAMQALDQLCFDARFRFTERVMRRFAEQSNALVWIAESDGVLVGFVIAHVDERGAYLVTLDVAPDGRRRGLAGQLVECVERAEGVDTVWLHVFVENDAAIRFYEGRGYRRMELAKAFYGVGMDGWVYLLRAACF